MNDSLDRLRQLHSSFLNGALSLEVAVRQILIVALAETPSQREVDASALAGRHNLDSTPPASGMSDEQRGRAADLLRWLVRDTCGRYFAGEISVVEAGHELTRWMALHPEDGGVWGISSEFVAGDDMSHEERAKIDQFFMDLFRELQQRRKE